MPPIPAFETVASIAWVILFHFTSSPNAVSLSIAGQAGADQFINGGNSSSTITRAKSEIFLPITSKEHRALQRFDVCKARSSPETRQHASVRRSALVNDSVASSGWVTGIIPTTTSDVSMTSPPTAFGPDRARIAVQSHASIVFRHAAVHSLALSSGSQFSKDVRFTLIPVVAISAQSSPRVQQLLWGRQVMSALTQRGCQHPSLPTGSHSSSERTCLGTSVH